MKKLLICLFALVLSFGVMGTGNAAPVFIDNGNNLIYDAVQNITWYAPDVSTIPNSVGGIITWYNAMNWVATLSVGGAADGSWSLPWTPATDQEVNNYTFAGQLGTLFYELGGVQGSSIKDTGNPDYLKLFPYLQPDSYWTSVTYNPAGLTDYALAYNFGSVSGHYGGWQAPGPKTYYALVMAVHDVNVGAPVPVPATVLLLGSGLIGLAGIRRKLNIGLGRAK